MRKNKLTVRVPRDLHENAKHFAAGRNTAFANLIYVYFRRLLTSQSMERAPIVRRLSGTLAMDVSPRDYKKHLEEKYAR